MIVVVIMLIVPQSPSEVQRNLTTCGLCNNISREEEREESERGERESERRVFCTYHDISSYFHLPFFITHCLHLPVTETHNRVPQCFSVVLIKAYHHTAGTVDKLFVEIEIFQENDLCI